MHNDWGEDALLSPRDDLKLLENGLQLVPRFALSSTAERASHADQHATNSKCTTCTVYMYIAPHQIAKARQHLAVAEEVSPGDGLQGGALWLSQLGDGHLAVAHDVEPPRRARDLLPLRERPVLQPLR